MSLQAWARGILVAQARRRAVGLPPAEHVAPVESPERATERRMDAALARRPRLSDRAIADELGLTIDVVRGHRESRGIAAAPQIAAREWEARIRGAWREGITGTELAEATGYTVATVRQRCHELGLRLAGRPGRPPRPV